MEVNFEEEKVSNDSSSYKEIGSSSKGITGAMIKSGLAKNAKQANIIMIIAIVALATITYILWPSTESTAPTIDSNINRTAKTL